MYYISLGPDCHMAGALNYLNLRKESLPFDFLLTDIDKGLEYVSLLIENNFNDFIENLEYNSNLKVISKNYPYAQFYHHDLLKNKQTLVKSLKIDHADMDELLIDKFKRRANRFIDIIKNDENKCIFLYKISAEHIINNDKLQKIISSIEMFIDIMNKSSKCKYVLIIFIMINDNNDLLKNNSIINNLNIKYSKNILFEVFIGSNNNEDNKNNIIRCLEKIKL